MLTRYFTACGFALLTALSAFAQQHAQRSPAANLASLDAGVTFPADLSTVAAYDRKIGALSRKTHSDAQRIADSTWSTKQWLQKQGVDITAYELLNQACIAAQGFGDGTDYKEIIAAVGILVRDEHHAL